MSSNLKFVVGDQPCVGCTTTPIMWDGREPNLQSQANNATLGHAQALQPLTTAQQDSIVAFETALFTAQDHVRGAGTLIHAGGGGPRALSEQPFAFKMNTVGPLPTPPKSFDAFALFAAFSTSDNELQQSILRGQQIFNRRQLKTTPAGVPVTCTTCHSSINVGGNDFPEPPINQATIGSAGRGPLSPPISDQFLAPDLPVYTFKNNATGAIVQVNDPGAALITGLWNDLGRFKVPNLRGLASHAPYFHNGLAPTLEDVVDFYDVTFAQNFPPGNIAPFSAQEKADLVAFMSAL
jgi:cytochrome c peroxidase